MSYGGSVKKCPILLSSDWAILEGFIRTPLRAVRLGSAVAASNVRCQMKTGKHLFILSFTGFDPRRTSETPKPHAQEEADTTMIRMVLSAKALKSYNATHSFQMHPEGGNHAEVFIRRQRRAPLPYHRHSRWSRRAMAISSSATCTSRPHATRWRSAASIAAMRYQHSYWYVNAKEVFEEAIKADPTCAMAHWGIALTLMDNPHNAIPRPNLAPGLAAIQKAKEIGAKTERERDYIDALMVMYADYDKLTHAQRMRALRDAQAKVAAKYPDDDEAQIAYAITLNTSADLNDKTYAQQTQGRRNPGADLQTAAAASGRRPTTSSTSTTIRRPRRRASTPPTATPRSRRPRRTPSTCRRTSTPASAIGRSRSIPTSPR